MTTSVLMAPTTAPAITATLIPLPTLTSRVTSSESAFLSAHTLTLASSKVARAWRSI